ncbi:MAG: hypothetical protein A3G75_09490 [Verrucomicrobia bacterium RIFCSPLOWO2_12_FULL_64_8]|nr:MAG: hypothetical protein A3G75_09490 [Verrucomicrobia bacterium RIFCSPLOWO2_12_FULL_64_8]
MNASEPSPPHGTPDEAAAEWLYEREEGFTAARAEEFTKWCNRDPRHARAVARMEQTLVLLDEMPAVRAPLEARLASGRAASAPRAPRRIIPFPQLAWTAALAAALVVGLTIWWGASLHAPAPPGEHYATDATAQRSLVLPDGSMTDINVGSNVSVRFTAAERRVTLNEGEAHFQVAPDTARPFIVTAGGISMRAVGTAFNVRLASEVVDVLVVEGKVELARAGAPLPTEALVPPLLHAGERAQVSREDPAVRPRIEKIDGRSIRDLLNWQNPMTSFSDVPLREVVVRFNRRNTTQLVLEDTGLGERKIGGVFALDQVDAFVRLLERDGDILVERQLAGQIRLRRAR